MTDNVVVFEKIKLSVKELGIRLFSWVLIVLCMSLWFLSKVYDVDSVLASLRHCSIDRLDLA